MERKIVKIRVDMYSDTKFKIIDTMEDRDLIHYIWTRLLTLAGKVNLEGELYLSKSIAYTIETLALEFNRSAKKVALALKVFMDLEMVELTKNNVYKVRNFAKHQNIKKNKKDINKDVLEIVDNPKVFVDKCDNHDFIITNEDKPKKGDMSKREIDKNKDLNNDINSIIDVEKIKKDSNLNIVDFNTNNKIKNDANYVNQNNIMQDNNAKDEIKIENKNDVANLKGNNVMNYITEDKENNNEVVFSDNKKTVNKDILDNEFVFGKSNDKKNKNNSKSKKKKKDIDEIICDWDQDGDDIEICEFTDKPPEGNVIANFEF